MTILPRDALVVGLGGNLGDVRSTFELARAELGRLGPLRSAPLYRSRAIGPTQPDFLNTAVCITCADQSPHELLDAVLGIERRLGRDRRGEQRWAARPIDLDILLWGDRAIDTPTLEVPHPRAVQRRFVIEPLSALFGSDLVIEGRTLAELEKEVAAQQVELIARVW